MIISPIKEGFPVTQVFGVNPKVYAQFGLAGHNGCDFGTPVGTPVYASFDGIVEVTDSGKEGYGLHIKLTESWLNERKQVVYGHLSEVSVSNLQSVKAGDKLGLTGNTGFSTGPHLHYGLRRLLADGKVKNANNGFKGYENIFGQGWLLSYTPSKY